MRLGGEEHNDFVIYAGRDFANGWRHRCIFVGLWAKSSCDPGEEAWLFQWKLSTRWFPRVWLWGGFELQAFGRVWLWRSHYERF